MDSQLLKVGFVEIVVDNPYAKPVAKEHAFDGIYGNICLSTLRQYSRVLNKSLVGLFAGAGAPVGTFPNQTPEGTGSPLSSWLCHVMRSVRSAFELNNRLNEDRLDIVPVRSGAGSECVARIEADSKPPAQLRKLRIEECPFGRQAADAVQVCSPGHLG
jgi:hypothetical protein